MFTLVAANALMNSGNLVLSACMLIPVGIFFLLAGRIFYKHQKKKSETMLKWALDQAEEQEITLIKGNTPEELNRLLDYHLKKGNLREADTISQKLMAIVETDPNGASPASANPGSAAAVQAIAANANDAGLPAWMKEKEEQISQKENLPNWMQ